MRMTALPRLTLALAVAAALTGCPEKDAAGTQAAATTDAQPAADAGYIFNGPVTIDYYLDSTLPVGRFTVTSSAVAGVDATEDATPSEIRAANLVVEVNGVRHPLTPPGVTIGRGTDADLRINDPGVSRLHARINVNGRGTDQRLDIEDLGSTNGITVDGQRTRHASLALGSRIEIGTTRLAIVSPVSDV